MKKIIVLGGSFNPPTNAHTILLNTAVDALSADMGIFAPSSDAYVRRKMSRSRTASTVYPEPVRLAMLEQICHKHPRLSVNTCEYGDDGRGHTYETLCRIQTQHPDAKLLFIIGADKLSIIPRWHSHDAFFREFEFVVTSRNGRNAEEFIVSHPVLRRYKTIFHIIPEPDGIQDISSTRARTDLLQNHAVDYLDPDVCRIARQYLSNHK